MSDLYYTTRAGRLILMDGLFPSLQPGAEMSESRDDWHTESCPLHEIDEDDCAYDLFECTCGWTPREEPR